MEYIFGIVGIVAIGGIVIWFLYTVLMQKNDLDDVGLNAREDRIYGNVDYDYDDDDRVEVFDDLIDFAKQAEDEEFYKTVDEINKFVARRSAEEESNNVDDIIQTPQVPVQPVVQQPVVQTPVAQQPVVSKPVVVERTMTTDELYSQINDDYVEEL